MAWNCELPLKIAVYEDSKGKVWAQTRPLPADIPAPEQEKRIAAMNSLLSKLVQIK